MLGVLLADFALNHKFSDMDRAKATQNRTLAKWLQGASDAWSTERRIATDAFQTLNTAKL
jgi:hypothetical protein